MDEHVWRVPTLLGVMAVSALLLFAAVVMSAVLIRRRPSISMKAGIGVVLVLLAVFAAVVLRESARQLARSLDINLAYVEPGLLGYLAPMMFAAFAFAVGSIVLKGAWTTRRALLFYVWLVGFTVANVINRCSPGWCATIGFPFAWQSWGDAILTFGDGHIATWFEAIGQAVAVALNLSTFAAVAGLVTRASVLRRSA